MNKVKGYLFVFPMMLCLLACDFGFDKALVSNAGKLISPDGKHTLYRYFVDTPMSFGSGFAVINIIPSDEQCDVTTRDILRFGNSRPFWIKWKDNKRINVKCLLDDGGFSTQQPVRKEVVKWKDWTFHVEYYHLYGSESRSDFSLESLSVKANRITFRSKTDSLTFNSDQVQLSLEPGHIHVCQFMIARFNHKSGLLLSNFDIAAKGIFYQKRLYKEQAFIRVKL